MPTLRLSPAITTTVAIRTQLAIVSAQDERTFFENFDAASDTICRLMSDATKASQQKPSVWIALDRPAPALPGSSPFFSSGLDCRIDTTISEAERERRYICVTLNLLGLEISAQLVARRAMVRIMMLNRFIARLKVVGDELGIDITKATVLELWTSGNRSPSQPDQSHGLPEDESAIFDPSLITGDLGTKTGTAAQ
jgi:hypothetical protein